MPAGCFHEIVDFVVFGTTNRKVHQRKDAPAQNMPGIRHREVGHDWYQSYDKQWDFLNPFPDFLHSEIEALRKDVGLQAAEERMASDAHDYLDRIWDDLSK